MDEPLLDPPELGDDGPAWPEEPRTGRSWVLRLVVIVVVIAMILVMGGVWLVSRVLIPM